MAFIGFVIAVFLFFRVKHRLEGQRRRAHLEADRAGTAPCGPVSWHQQWHGQWAEKFERQAERRRRHIEQHARKKLKSIEKKARRLGLPVDEMFGNGASREDARAAAPAHEPAADPEVRKRARRRVQAQVGFYIHLMSYLGVIALLALINVFTTRYPWFMWPALGWGIGLFSHYMAVFGSHLVKERYFAPAVEREVRRERVAMHTEKQASIDELSSTIAHEIRNPIAAAKSLVQQMGEDPQSVENVEYAKVALDELDRVERRISHLLKYAKEEDYDLAPVNVATVVDAALTQMRAKLEAARVSVVRNYISGPTLIVDAEKLRQVFTNVIDNAIDGLDAVAEGRRIDLFISNGSARATVRVRDNGCGIPPEKIDRIFNPFFTTKETGTGLGMAISKKIVEAHEGTIDVTSEAGKGAEFVITLPMPQ